MVGDMEKLKVEIYKAKSDNIKKESIITSFENKTKALQDKIDR